MDFFAELRETIDEHFCDHMEAWLSLPARTILDEGPPLPAGEAKRIRLALGATPMRAIVLDRAARALAPLGDEERFSIAEVAEAHFWDFERRVHGGAGRPPTPRAQNLPTVPLDKRERLEWLRARGLEECLDRRLDAIGLSAMSYEVARLLAGRPPTIGNMLELPSAKGRRGDPSQTLRNLALSELARIALRAELEDRRLERHRVIAALAPPPSLNELDRQLAALEARCPPRPRGAFVSSEAQFYEDPPAIGYQELDPTTGAKSEHVFIQLGKGAPFIEPRVRIDATLVAFAVEAARRLIRDREAPTHEALSTWAKTPAWSRALRAIDQVLSVPLPPARPIGQIGFRLTRRAKKLSRVEVVEVTSNAKGRASLRPRRISHTLREDLDDRDARILDSIFRAEYGHELRIGRTLEALAGHPRVFLAGSAQPVRVTRGTFQLSLIGRDGRFAFAVRVGDRLVSPEDLARASIEDDLAVFDDRPGELAVVRIPRDAQPLLSALSKAPADFPPASHRELLTRLETMTARGVAIELPDELLGDSVAPDERLIVRLDGTSFPELALAMRTRPLAGGPLCVPGEGEARVHVLNEAGAIVHARRDLDREREMAAELTSVLGLDEHSAKGPCDHHLTDPHRAASLLATLRAREAELTIEWTAMPRLRSLRPKELKVKVSRGREWFSIGGELAIDGDLLGLATLLEAAQKDQRYVALGGSRFVELEDRLRKQLLAVADHVRTTRGELELSPTAAPALAELSAESVELDAEPSFQGVLSRVADASSYEPEIPAHLNGVLRPYQAAGFSWLARLASWGAGACLADDMGLGKTVQTIALLHHRRSLGPALVVAPTSVVGNWIAELAKFGGGLRAILHRGAGRLERLSGLASGDVVVTSYDLAVRDASALAALEFATLVVDEAQFIKNQNTQRARAIRALGAQQTVALTGTPIENHLGELWSILRVACPGLLGSWEHFRARYALPIEQRGDEAARKSLARLIRPFVLRRTKEAVAPELPPLTEIVHSVELTERERAAYEAARATAVKELEGRANDPDSRFAILAALTRLRRLACHPRLCGVALAKGARSAKLEAFVDVATEIIESGHRALVFSQFTDHLAIVREELDRLAVRYHYLDGSTPAEEREKRVAAFQAGDAPLFLISLRAGGTGLNLTGADYVMHLDPWWNPAVEDQASDRAHRIGQTRAVTVIRLVTRGTIEEAVVALHREKRALAESLLDGTDAAARLSTRELVDLLRDAPAADDEG